MAQKTDQDNPTVNQPIQIPYKSFVVQEIQFWKDKGIKTKLSSDDDDSKSPNNEEYKNKTIEPLIMTVYKSQSASSKSSAFVSLLLLFCHQIVIGRLMAAYAQIPADIRNKTFLQKQQLSTRTLLDVQWSEKGINNKEIKVDFRRVYLIYLTNYLNRMWQLFHIDLEKEKMNAKSDEYVHVKTIQSSLNDIIDSTKMSTKKHCKLEKAIVYQKIVEHCCDLCGAMIDALMFKYDDIKIDNLEQLYVVFSLIVLQINEVHRSIEEKWIKRSKFGNNHLKNKSGDENFVTFVLKDEAEHATHVPTQVPTKKNEKQ